ncbi:MAG TPA: flagellar type III secretion system protein FlhB, partial [Rhizomicrobium sp.]
GMARTFRVFLAQPDQIGIGPGELLGLMRELLGRLALILGPVFGVMMIAGVAGNMLQHRPVFTFEKIKPSFSKISLLSGFKRLFGVDGFANLFKGMLKIVIVSVAVWTQLWPERGGFETVLQQSPAGVAGDMAHFMFKVLIAALVAMTAIAGADYALQRFQFLKRNRMSKHEIKEEYRQTEGDPMIKAKIRQLRQERARRRMIAAVPEATVVIVNPTHFAVALKYESGKMAAPICVAKGVDALALRIREVAEKHAVPIVENPPLARTLHAAVEVDEPIPPEHYKAVAQVIGYVMRLTGKLRAN